MNFEPAEKMKNFEAGIFQILDKKKKELEKQGKKIYNFSVGTPDFETPECVMKAVSEACLHPENYHYSLGETEELLEAVVHRYKKRYHTDIAKNEIMSVYGSQEGMAHIGLVMCDPGDVMLVPNPGYPVFGIGPELMGAKIETYPLYKENNFIPNFDDIPEETARKAKFMIISYPANPVCSVADDEFYEKAIAFAKKYNVMILHDNAYSDIVFGGKEGKSFLSYPGAMEVGIEFYSLSLYFSLVNYIYKLFVPF